MFGTIRKHQQWLWAIIITVIIISFVIFFSPYSKMQNERRRSDYGSINGEKVTEDGYMNAQREVYLRYFMMTGRWPDENAQRMGFDPDRETYNWLLILQKQKETGISVSSDLAIEKAREMITQFQRSGIETPGQFIQQVLNPKGFTADDLERFVRHYMGIEQLMASIGAGGKLVTPQEARTLYQREHREIAAEVVTFSSSNFLASVTVTPEALGEFYTNQLANYRIPERLQVSYVKFPISNYLAQAETELAATNLNDMVLNGMERIGTNYATYFPGVTNVDQAKARIREEIIKGRAGQTAFRSAAAFATPLMEAQVMKADDLAAHAKSNNLPVAITAPFERSSTPPGLAVGPEFGKAAFERTPEDPFAGPIRGTDAAYVIALEKRIPSEVPPLDSVRAKVTVDYKQYQAIQLAIQKGTQFFNTITNALAQGKAFDDAANGAGYAPIKLPPFSISTRSLPGDIEDKVNINQFKQLAFSLTPGKAGFEPGNDGAVIVFVKEKLPIDETKLIADLPGFTASVRQSRMQEAFNNWFRKESEKGLRFTPVAQPKAPPSMKSDGTAKS